MAKKVKKYHYNYSMLRGRIREKCNTETAFAEKLSKDRAVLNSKLNGFSQFTQDEIVAICDLLQIDYIV